MGGTTRRFSGEALRQIRHKHGLTQYELATRAGVRERQIIRWENDQNAPRFEAVASLAEATGERMDAFFVAPVQGVAVPPSGESFRRGGSGRGVDGSAGSVSPGEGGEVKAA